MVARLNIECYVKMKNKHKIVVNKHRELTFGLYEP